MKGVMEYNPLLGRRARSGDWEEQTIPTWRKIREAVIARQWDDAAELADYFVDEAAVITNLYRQWLPDIYRYLETNGVPEKDIEAARKSILHKLVLPDGRPFDEPLLWAELLAGVQEFVKKCHREQSEPALSQLEDIRERWRQLHDRGADHCYGAMNLVVERLGEEHLYTMYMRILQPWFAARYQQFDIDRKPWGEALDVLLYVAIEAMRGHFGGPDRIGDIELVEEEDRYVLKFDPCGSGQRAMRGDPVEGTPSRMQPPYSWGVTTQEYDWAWNKKGICYYCAHCCILMEQIPIDNFGYPVRVVEPPTLSEANEEKCSWIMYKDPTAIPESYYKRVGRKKPGVFGSKGRNGAR